MALGMRFSGQEPHEVRDYGEPYRSQWGQEFPIGLDNAAHAVGSLMARWPAAMRLIIELSDEIRSNENFQEVGQV